MTTALQNSGRYGNMARIIEKSLADLEQDERFGKSVDIAQRMVGSHHVFVNNNLHVIDVHNSNLLVYSASKVLIVNDPSQFDLAIDLADEYEQKFGPEYRILKKY